MTSKNMRLMQGNRACVEGALAAGMKFFAGYPITPSTEIAEFSSEDLPKIGGKFIQMEDEIASISAIIGASLAGLKSMTATSGPGFSLKQEGIGYAIITETPCVIVNVQRGGPSTGLPTAPAQGDIMQARWGTHGDHSIIALYPSSVSEIFYTTIRAFNLAEKYRTPVILLLDEVIGHMREKVEIPKLENIDIFNRLKPKKDSEHLPYQVLDDEIVPRMAAFGECHRFHVTGLVHDETGFPKTNAETSNKLIKRLSDKIENNKDDIVEYEEYEMDDAEEVLIGYGATARSCKAVVRRLRRQGRKIGMFRPITIWPSPERQIIDIAKRVKRIIVVEMNLGQYFLEVDRIGGKHTRIIHFGRVDGELISPDDIIDFIEEVSHD